MCSPVVNEEEGIVLISFCQQKAVAGAEDCNLEARVKSSVQSKGNVIDIE